jgi:deoxyribose-phosphate aldolase
MTRMRVPTPTIDTRRVSRSAKTLAGETPPPSTSDLMRIVSLLDLAALSEEETPETVRQTCEKAMRPLLRNGGPVAGLCVFPEHVGVAREVLKGSPVRLVSVAGAFPTGRAPLGAKVEEIRDVIERGAHEVDAVIARGAVLRGDLHALADEIGAFREACGKIPLKVILTTGALRTLSNIELASRVAIAAGADFIKTSTGRERVNATLVAGVMMAQVIREHGLKTGRKVGLKPSGGIRTADQALRWIALVRRELGEDWLSPILFRIGASGLLADVAQRLQFS